MALDQQSQALLASMQGAKTLNFETVSLEQSRHEFTETFKALDVPRVEVGRRLETTVPGLDGAIPVRLYWPTADGEGDPCAALVLIHGGGWVLGSIADYENLARDLCMRCGMAICSVEYRLAPENKYPAGLEDSCAALRWLGANAVALGIDPQRIGVVGDSAGGNLAAAACLALRDDKSIRIAAQILLYAAVMAARDYTSPSRETLGNGEYFPSRLQLEWAIDNYVRSEADRVDPLVSPLLERDLTGLPPALIITAGYDAFRDEAAEYGDRLRGAGVPVSYRCLENTIHGYWCYAGMLDPDARYRDYIATEAKRLLG